MSLRQYFLLCKLYFKLILIRKYEKVLNDMRHVHINVTQNYCLIMNTKQLKV